MMPSSSAPTLKDESLSNGVMSPGTTKSLSNSTSLHAKTQPPLAAQFREQGQKAKGAEYPGKTVMSSSSDRLSVRLSQTAVNLSATPNRHYYHTRNYQAGSYDQTDYSNWREYTLLDLYVTNLPINASTLQIWRNFRKYGELYGITINDNKEHYSTRAATISFKPPPSNAFWERHEGVKYQHGDKTSRTVQVRLDKKQRKNYVVPSPVRHGITYNEEHVLVGHSIDFGVLTNPSSMLVLKTRRSDVTFGVKLQLDLRKKEITVYFPSAVTSEKSGLVVREYRFKVALDQQFSLSQVDEVGNDVILLLEIDKPPPYSKKLSEAVAGSHVEDARRWSVEDAWARQTDIADTKDALLAISKTPVSVRNKFASIDIGRWLAFRLVFSKTQSNIKILSIVQSALRDFNVPIKEKPKIYCKVAESVDEPVLWDILNRPCKANNENASSNVRDLTNSATTLEFPIRYQLEVCVSHGYLSEYTIDADFLHQLASLSRTKALQFLRAVDIRGQTFLKPAEIFDDLGFRKPIKKPKLPDNCIEIHHATVTATKVYFNTPSVEITNRVIRQYKQHADRFLRVRFEDDDYRGSTRLFSSVNNKMINIFTRVRRTLTHGIVLGDRHYKFLAWGNSQLREHGAYFFADLPAVITAANIRAKMGEFSNEKIVAKCAARMGQCFSTTRSLPSRIPRIYQSVCIPDVKSVDKKYNFTDGVGMMSDLVASMAGMQMGIRGESPSVIQFRLGGCKGVLAYDPSMNGTINLKVRDSQFKFSSSSNELELIRCSSFANADLNRQLILVLSELGVKDCVFLKRQEDLIKDIEGAMVSDDAALKALKDRVDSNFMTPVIANLVSMGKFRTSNEPFVMAILHLWRSWSLKYLKEKAKLPIPKSAFVLGCIDETQTLRGHFNKLQPAEDASYEEKEKALPEIFVQVTDPLTHKVQVIEGICVVARNPSLHKGDVRVVKAVDVPALHHLRDAVVFPQTGDRDLPSMCSGGDLDGDDFVVVWDEELLPETWNASPFHYNPPVPVQAEGDVTTEQIISFFVDYMENDFLGRIAHAHLGWADDKGIDSKECLQLVQLHSLSVDFPKTGVPARMERHLERIDGWPHFMEKRGKKYKSHKILGRLFDAVERADFIPKYKASFDSRILNALEPGEHLYQQVQILKGAYDESMRQIMAQHQIKTEFEVWSTFVLDHSKKSNDFKFHEEIGRLSGALKEQYFDEISALMGGRDLQHLAPFAVAAYQVTQTEVDAALQKVSTEERLILPLEMPFISFPWVLHDTLTKIAAGGLKELQPDEKGILFDADGNPMVQTSTGDLVPIPDSWRGLRYADPYQDDVVSLLPSSMDSGAVQNALTDIQVVPTEQSKTCKVSEAAFVPDALSGSNIDTEGSHARDEVQVINGRDSEWENGENPTSRPGAFADPASASPDTLGSILRCMRVDDSNSD